MKIPTWLRSVAGIATGALNLYANGHSLPQILVSAGIAAIGVFSHLSSTSDTSATSGVKPGAVKTSGPGWQ